MISSANSNDEKDLKTPRSDQTELDQALNEVKTAIERIEFGSVLVVIQNGRIVQIDATEKKRLA